MKVCLYVYGVLVIPGVLQSPAEPSSSSLHPAVDSTVQPENPASATQDTTDRKPTRPAASQESQAAEGAGKQTSVKDTGPQSSTVDSESQVTYTTWSFLGRASMGVQSIMKRKEDPVDPKVHQRNLQFVGVNGG